MVLGTVGELPVERLWVDAERSRDGTADDAGVGVVAAHRFEAPEVGVELPSPAGSVHERRVSADAANTDGSTASDLTLARGTILRLSQPTTTDRRPSTECRVERSDQFVALSVTSVSSSR